MAYRAHTHRQTRTHARRHPRPRNAQQASLAHQNQQRWLQVVPRCCRIRLEECVCVCVCVCLVLSCLVLSCLVFPCLQANKQTLTSARDLLRSQDPTYAPTLFTDLLRDLTQLSRGSQQPPPPPNVPQPLVQFGSPDRSYSFTPNVPTDARLYKEDKRALEDLPPAQQAYEFLNKIFTTVLK